MNIHIK